MKLIFLLSAALMLPIFTANGTAKPENEESDGAAIAAKVRAAVDPSGALATATALRLQLEDTIAGKKIRGQQNVYFANGGYYFSETKSGILTLDARGGNGQIFWKKNAAGVVTKVSGGNAKAMRFLSEFMRPGSDLTKIFVKITCDRRKYLIGNFECWVLKCSPPPEFNLPPYLIYVDKHDFLIRRTVITAPDYDRTIPVTTDFHEYRDFDHALVPASFTIYLPNATINSRTINCILLKGMPGINFNPPAGLNN